MKPTRTTPTGKATPTPPRVRVPRDPIDEGPPQILPIDDGMEPVVGGCSEDGMGSDVGLLSVRIDAVVESITVRPVGWVSFGSSFHRDGGTRDYSHGKRNEPDGKQRVGSTLSSFPIDPTASPDKGGRGNGIQCRCRTRGKEMGRQARKERRKARWNRRGEQEEGGGGERQPEDTMDGERYPAAIDVHPTKPVAVVGLGKAAFLVDLEQSRTTRIVQVDTSDHQDQGIRSVRFNPGGTAIAVAGDDKHLRMWDENLERCLVEVKLAKKISAVVFAEDGRKLLVSDRFGDVYSVECGDMQMACAPQPFLGHFGSAIQDIQLSPCGRFVVTCDADGKIRVSRMPKDLLKGAHEIESFCLGHTGTVFKTDFVGGADCSHLLLSSGNDDTLRLWDIRTGVQIHQLDLNLSEASWKGSDADFPTADGNAAKEDHVVSTSNGHPDEGKNGIPKFSLKKNAFLIADRTKQMFAVAQEVSAAIFLLSVDVQSQRIVLQQRLLCPENHIPLCGAYNMSGDLLLLGRAREGQSAFFMLAQRRPGAHSLHFNEAWKLDSDGEVTHGET